MDSFQSFGLCDKALEYNVEVELPDSSIKHYQFHSRHTVDKIKTTVMSDSPVLKKQLSSDFVLAIENSKIEIDFLRFIVSHPKITETLERDPVVKIQLVPKNSISLNSSSGNLYNSKERSTSFSTNVKVSDLKSSLEKSPGANRISGGGRPISPVPELTTSTSKLNLFKKEKSCKDLEKDLTKEFLKEKDNNKTPEKDSNSSLKLSEGNGEMTEEEVTAAEKDLKEKFSFKTLKSPKIKSFILSTFDNKKRNSLTKPRSSEDLSYATIHVASTLRPRTQEYPTGYISKEIVNTPINKSSDKLPTPTTTTTTTSESIELVKDYSLVQQTKGFTIEPQRKVSENLGYQLDSLITSESWFCKYFLGNEHWSYIGEDEKSGTFIISVIKDVGLRDNIFVMTTSSELNSNGNSVSTSGSSTNLTSTNMGTTNIGCSLNLSTQLEKTDKRDVFKVLLRTKSSDIFTESSIKVSTPGFFNSSNKPPIKELIQSVSQDLSCKNIKLIKNTDIQKELALFEEKQRIKSFKFGILYCAPNQFEEEDMFSNEKGSEKYNEFLEFLGQRVKLKGWPSYRAGLDVKSDTTGTESIYDKYQGFEVMFHVSTMLPHSLADPQQVEKKRHIGNDIVVIIFKDGDQVFEPKVMKSDFNHVFIIISPDKTNPKRYKISVVYKDGVGFSQPHLNFPASWELNQEFKDFLFCKLINSEITSYEATSFKIKIQRTRLALLKDISNTYSES
eukprot:gene5734-7131_t